MAVSISQVSFEHHYPTALGIGETEPRISWRFSGSAVNWTQGGYAIEVSRGSQQDIFEFNSTDQSVLVPWPTVALSATEKAQVRVRAYGADDKPDTNWSDVYNVETGLLGEADWGGASMIAMDNATITSLPRQPVLFRKQFEVDAKEIAQARLYITAFGLYEAEINGQRVGDHVLAPGWQSYNYRQVYDSYDVTDLIKAGDKNAIGIQVGEGWYAGMLGGSRNRWGSSIGALALLAITGTDGTTKNITTDDSWQAGTGPLVLSEIYNGESYNAGFQQSGWSEAGFETDASWKNTTEIWTPFSRLAAPDGPPIRRTEEVKLSQVLTSPSGKTILDFGQNLAGWLQVKVKGPANTTITMKHVEVLEDGEIATRPLRGAAQTDTLILAGTEETLVWEPKFTYHGFRYVQVDGWPTNSIALDGNAVKAIVVHSDMQETGYFGCSDSLLSKLHQNIRWSMKANFMSIPTDCPQRDERMGWTGDAHAFAPTANFLYDTSGFWKSWLKDVNKEQYDNSYRAGAPPSVIPKVSTFGVRPTAIWGDVVIANPWVNYLFFADRDVLEQQFTGAKLWLDQGIPRNSDGLWERNLYQYGDWLDPLAPAESPGSATTAKDYVADAYLVYVTGLIAQIAEAIGNEEAAANYTNAAATLKDKFLSAWAYENGTVAYETQTGLVLPLWFDLFSSDNHTEAAAGRLQNIIKANNYLVGTGFAGTHLLGPTLSKYNLTSVFYEMIAQTTVPSWLYQVVMNGTTTWERWDSLLADGSVNPGTMTSFNHYAFGSIGNWMHRTIGGLAPKDPGWKTVEVRPEPGGGLTEGWATFNGPYGYVSSSWKITSSGTFRLAVKVPPNSEAEIVLPGSERRQIKVGSGTHTYSVRGDEL